MAFARDPLADSSTDDAHLALTVPPFDHSGDVVRIAGDAQSARLRAFGDLTPSLLEPHPQRTDVVRPCGQPDNHGRLRHERRR